MIEDPKFKKSNIKREARRMKDNFGPNLRAYRIKKGLTQEDLASKAGITVGYVSMIESGKRSPSLPHMLALASLLGVSYSDMFKGE